jgi:hypothetical protein
VVVINSKYFICSDVQPSSILKFDKKETISSHKVEEIQVENEKHIPIEDKTLFKGIITDSFQGLLRE